MTSEDIFRFRQQQQQGNPVMDEYMPAPVGVAPPPPPALPSSPLPGLPSSPLPGLPSSSLPSPITPQQRIAQAPEEDPYMEMEPEPVEEDPTETNALRIYQRIRDLYTPETANTTKFNDLLNNMPKRESPSWFRTAVAAALSVKAQDPVKTASEVMDVPHNRDIEDWKAQADASYKGAGLENTANANERALINNMLTAEAAEQRIRETERNNRERAEIARITAEANALKAEKWDVQADGDRFVAFSPNRQEMRVLGSSRGMSKENEINLRGMLGIAAQEARGESAIRTAQAVAQATGQGLVGAGTEGFSFVPKPGGAPGEFIQTNLPPGALTKPGSTSKLQGVDPQALNKIRSSAQEALAAFDQVIDKSTDELMPGIEIVVGRSRMLGRHLIPGSPAVGAEDKVKNLKSQLIIDLIAEMKAQSKTGATGFGQLTGRELDLLEAAASRINPAANERDFIVAVKEVRDKFRKILQPGPDEEDARAGSATNYTPIQQRAADWLAKQPSKPLITPANIDAVIKAGKVK